MIYISFDIGFKNLAMCILKQNIETIEIIDWRIITLADNKKEIKNIDELSERLFMELDNTIGTLKCANIDNIDYVLIENQPSNLNGIMKTIQHIIYTYFSLLKYWENIVSKVCFINASLKLKNHDYIGDTEMNTQCKKNSKGFTREKYKWNKATSIAICRQYIDTDENLLQYFETNKKKDDLSDSFLQAVSYMRFDSKIKLNKTILAENNIMQCVN